MPQKRRDRRVPVPAEPLLPEFARIQRGPLFAWVRRSHYEAVRASGFLAEALPASGELVTGGRGGAVRVALPGGGAAVLREYRRGGMPARFLGDLHLAAGRSYLELLLHEELQRRGIPTLRVLAARTVRVGCFFFKHAILTEEVDAQDLLAAAEAGPERRRNLASAAGRAVRRLHDAGFAHPDLHPRNLLVEWTGADPRVLVIDLDRGGLRAPLRDSLRASALTRFARYFQRHRGATRFTLSPRDSIRFLRAYLGVEDAAAPERRAKVESLREELRRRLARSVFWHGLRWRA